ncbi:MAG: hypothetical protein BHW51_03310 [Ruminococcus sp. CAG:9-related_41_34]|nr:MAG: hypothetical protein BHW51_03310 [Ruminococcus sp. CAG:9-related_41_34]
MGFGGQKNWGRQEIFLVSGAKKKGWKSQWGLAGKKIGDDRKYFWFQVRDCRAVTAHFVHNNAPCNDRLCK